MTAARKPTKRQMLGESSRNQILDAAMSLLAERGYAGMSLSALSSKAELPISSIYWHFGSKDGVLAAVVERRLLEYFQRHPDSRLLPGEPRQRLETMIQHSAELLEREPDYLRLLLILTLERHEQSDQSTYAIERMRARALDRWTDAIADAAGGAEVSLAGLSVRELAIFSRAVADGALIAGLASDDTTTSQVYDILRRVLCALLDYAAGATPPQTGTAPPQTGTALTGAAPNGGPPRRRRAEPDGTSGAGLASSGARRQRRSV